MSKTDIQIIFSIKKIEIPRQFQVFQDPVGISWQFQVFQVFQVCGHPEKLQKIDVPSLGRWKKHILCKWKTLLVGIYIKKDEWWVIHRYPFASKHTTWWWYFFNYESTHSKLVFENSTSMGMKKNSMHQAEPVVFHRIVSGHEYLIIQQDLKISTCNIESSDLIETDRKISQADITISFDHFISQTDTKKKSLMIEVQSLSVIYYDLWFQQRWAWRMRVPTLSSGSRRC